MNEEVNDTYDPFGADIAQAQLIVSMKIYDVLMALLTDANPKMAADLDALHTQGVVIGQSPTFVEFMSRELGEESEEPG